MFINYNQDLQSFEIFDFKHLYSIENSIIENQNQNQNNLNSESTNSNVLSIIFMFIYYFIIGILKFFDKNDNLQSVPTINRNYKHSTFIENNQNQVLILSCNIR